MNQTQYFHSCGYDLIGTCQDCTSLYPGNWWSQLDEEDGETCCTPTRYIRAKRILYSVNETSECPPIGLLSQVGEMWPGLLTCAGLIAAGVTAYCIYRCIRKRRDMNNENQQRASAATTTAGLPADDGLEWIEMGNLTEAGDEEPAESTNAAVTAEKDDDDDDDDYRDRETASVKSEADMTRTEVADMYAGLAEMWNAEKEDDDKHIYEEIFFMED